MVNVQDGVAMQMVHARNTHFLLVGDAIVSNTPQSWLCVCVRV